MQRTVERALIARLGTVAFVAALGLPALLSGPSARASVVVASVVEDAPVPLPPVVIVVDASSIIDLPELLLPARAADSARAASLVEESEPPPPAPAVEPTAVLGVAAAPQFPPPEPLVADGVVVASWYGPGFYGNRTACGQTYTPEIPGVAHRLLPCGTPIRITSPAGITVVVPVIDRGPFIAGRSLDLSNATRLALNCSDLCRVRMTILQ